MTFRMQYSTDQTCAIKPQISLLEWEILSRLPTALVITNSQGKIVWLNPLAEDMLGYGLLGSLWLDVLPGTFVPKSDEGQEVSLANGRRVHIALATLDSLPGILINLTDLTTAHDYEREHEQRLVSIGMMTAHLAHQIRTPLASAMLFTDHLNSLVDIDERAQNWLYKLKGCHYSIEQQIQDLLLFARGAAIEPALMDMNYWCSQLIERVEVYSSAHAVLFKVNNRLISPKAMIHGESLIGAVLNLVINAIQSEATEVYLTLSSMDNSGLHIAVDDNGKGMSEEVKTQAFSPFYTTKAQGTGLGLAVVFAVVKAHGGEVSLESMEGVGTQVNLYLP